MFYTYIHCKPDLTPFYIGKGKGNRAYDLSPRGRNKWHANIVNKYGKDNIVIEVMPCASEKEAFYREITVIRALKLAGIELCNITEGGTGGLTSSIANISAKMKIFWTVPGNIIKQKSRMKLISNSDEFKRNVSEKTKNALSGKSRENHLKGLAKANAAQSTQQRSEAQLKSYANNPQRRNTCSITSKLAHENMSAESKKSRTNKLREANLSSWSNPEIRARRIAGMQKRNKNKDVELSQFERN